MSNTPAPEAPKRRRFVVVLKALWEALTNNWGFKLLSLAMALVLWAALISQDEKLTREKVFTTATISEIGDQTIKRNGFIVVNDLTDQLNNVTMRVDVPQLKYEDASVSDYNLRIDLSRVHSAGPQELTVMFTNSTTYGNVSSVEPSTVHVEVEEYESSYRVPVQVNLTGELDSGWYHTVPKADPSIITVSGPKSLVESIVRAEVTLDLSTVKLREGTARTSLPFRLVDSEGNDVESALLEIASTESASGRVVVEQDLYPAKTIGLSDVGMVIGTPAEGYEVKAVTITPAQVTVAAQAAALEGLDVLYPDSTLDVSGLSSSVNKKIKIRVPSELVYLNPDSVTVAVEIGPVIATRSFPGIRIAVTSQSAGQRIVLSSYTADVMVQGAFLSLGGLRSSMLGLSCDVTGLGPGTYELPLNCTVNSPDGESFEIVMTPATVQVTISE